MIPGYKYMCGVGAKLLQLCLTLSDPMDCSLPGSSVHGIFLARVLEWGAIAFSGGPLLKSIKFVTILLLFFMLWVFGLQTFGILVPLAKD